MNKFGAKYTQIDGLVFDSKREAARYIDLKLLQQAGKISGLTCQVPFVLAPGCRLHGDKRSRPPIRYKADFVYSALPSGVVVVEDVKGMDTPMGRLKRHLMATTLGIQVRVIK